ncbi:J domain-containing protein [Halocatena pleomorpha]|uniref:J domain-containing protein n=1 Tax=Halocatena pleomorpha TaxID=1785090 RepID=A0A3P3RBG0_9EURY|nr:J domain-containing protein [Halocatena pleomorpha]RRJ30278.1 J domain-containing protein [Halocatena pleomorpha]
MERNQLVMGLAIVFAGLAAVVAVAAIAHAPFVVILALLFGAVAYFMWYQASGRLTRRLYQMVENRARSNDGRAERGGFGAGPRDTRRGRTRRGGRRGRRQASNTNRRRDPSGGNRGDIVDQSGLTNAQAYEILDIDPNVGETAVKEAYREKVKDVHPDTENGCEEAFKQVNEAYEQLTN